MRRTRSRGEAPDDRLHEPDLLRFTTAAASTTARAPSSGACSTTRRRSSRTSSSTSRTLQAPRGRERRPRAADRRPARRARAGHHDRRRLPLLRDAAKRKFIIADTPGHIQYTRNMVTGASTANLAIVLVDARKGVIEQTAGTPSSPTCCASSTSSSRQQDGPRRLVAGGLRADRQDFKSSRRARQHRRRHVHPDQRAARRQRRRARPNMPWYQGPSLLYHLEHVYVGSDRRTTSTRASRCSG
jgi:hypothetical protein